MKFELRYFSGTGNSWRILKTCAEVFSGAGHMIRMLAVEPGAAEELKADVLGFCFPVYAFGIPRICRKYLSRMAVVPGQKAFVIITAGDPDEAGLSVNEAVRFLRRKKCEVIYTAVVHMPANWTVAVDPPSKEEAREIIEKGLVRAKTIAGDLLNGRIKFHTFNIPVRYGKFGMYKEYIMFRYLGISNLWRSFKVYDTCNGCALCAKICPTGSIMIKDNKPVWSKSCEQCMRCVNYCPHESIYQGYGGETKGRQKYHEPGFKPQKRQTNETADLYP